MNLGNFIPQEFVPEEFYKLMGDHSMEIMDEGLINFIVKLREVLGKRITINTWFWKGRLSSRGLRLKGSTYYSPTSQHSIGKALDFDVEGMTAEEVRQWIIANRHLDWVKPITFIEDGVSWVHVDVGTTGGRVKGKIVLWHVKTHKSIVYA